MISDTLAKQFELSAYTLAQNLEGLDHEDSLARPAGGGNCINWVLGHLVATRNSVHALLGLEPALAADVAAVYGRGADGDVTGGLELPALRAAYEGSQARLGPALAALGDAGLARGAGEPSPITGSNVIGVNLAALAFHEAYHAGQVGSLRRLAAGRAGALE
jgi:hypothetical protein